LHKHW